MAELSREERWPAAHAQREAAANCHPFLGATRDELHHSPGRDPILKLCWSTPNSYREGLRWGTTTSSSTRPRRTSDQMPGRIGSVGVAGSRDLSQAGQSAEVAVRKLTAPLEPINQALQKNPAKSGCNSSIRASVCG
jgi:hypothetical protein